MEYPSLDKPKAGAVRFNTDSSQLEIYDGNQWTGVLSTSPELQTGGTRGLVGGGNQPGVSNVIQYQNIDSTGNFSDFGDLTRNTILATSFSSRTRGIWGGGLNPSSDDTIDYVTISQLGNATDFGNLDTSKHNLGGLSSQTRGIFAGGQEPSIVNTMTYVTIAATGNSVDFGDISSGTRYAISCWASPTRGLMTGGASNNVIEYLTIATLGNTSDFGDLIVGVNNQASASNAVRGITSSGTSPSTNIMSYVTNATLGDALDFGDSTQARSGHEGMASPTRAVFAGGHTDPAKVDTVDYVHIMTTGNATDFGNLVAACEYPAVCSNGHGGL